MKCITCHKEHEEKFCPYCGESSHVERITFQSILGSVIATVSNMDKGFLYNLKNLTLAPKETVESYIQGKRKGIYNPIAYAILAITLYLIIDSLMNYEVQELDSRKIQNLFVYQLGYEVGRLQSGYLKYFWLLNILLLSVFTRIFLKKYNYFEHLTINSFVLGHASIFGIITFLLFGWHIGVNLSVWLVILVLLFFIFKEAHTKMEIALLSIVSVGLCYAAFIFIPVLIISIRKFYF